MTAFVLITAVSDRTESLDLESDILDSRKYDKTEPLVILASQKRDPSISRVLAYKLHGRKPPTREICRELPYTRKLLREWPKLDVGKHGFLRRRCGEHVQLVLPREFHPLVYKELHQEMGHQGSKLKKKFSRHFATGYKNLVASSRILIAKLTNHD